MDRNELTQLRTRVRSLRTMLSTVLLDIEEIIANRGVYYMYRDELDELISLIPKSNQKEVKKYLQEKTNRWYGKEFQRKEAKNNV